MAMFRKRPQSLLKSYIDAQLLLIRVEKLKKQGSTRVLNADEDKELAQCISTFRSERLTGVENVSEVENAELVAKVKSRIQEVQNLNNKNRQLANQAANKASNERLIEVRKAEKARQAEFARKAEVNPVPGKIQAMAEWVRYWDTNKNRPYFHNRALTQTVWVLPEGCPFRHGNTESSENQGMGLTKARFQILNPYLVS
jgi:hypothetical protein